MGKIKVIIADDEPKVRRSLKKHIEWERFDMEVIGDAEDGAMALRQAQNLKPDIMLVDICMPFMNGLQLIGMLKEVVPACLVIVVTGHDEFTYAQQSIKLNVFDFLLKPIVKDQMYRVLEKAKETIEQKRIMDNYMDWATKQLTKNMPYLRERFFNDWITGNITNEEIDEQMDFFGQKLESNLGMLIIKISEKFSGDIYFSERDRQLMLFASKNMIVELLEELQPNIVFRDIKDNIIAIIPVKEDVTWGNLGLKLKNTIEEFLKQEIIVVQNKISDGKNGVPFAYSILLKEISKEENLSPIVISAKNYIDAHYYKNDLTLQDISNEFKISPAYLSRLLRQELGVSFIDYLTQVRIKKALMLLKDPFLKIYEISDKVGYSSQHYFSTAFKKAMGISPLEYRKGGGKVDV